MFRKISQDAPRITEPRVARSLRFWVSLQCLNDRPERANHSVGPFSLDTRQAPLHGVQLVLVLTLGSAGRPALAKANAPAQENPFQESYLFNHSRRSESGNIM